MTEHNPFIPAILENWEDDAPRLICTDWFEENGQPERAEFIRIQCQLTRLPEDNPCRPELHQRQDALLATHQDNWDRELHQLVRRWSGCQIALRYRRGFVEWVALDTAGFLKHAETLFQVAPVRAVKLACA